MRNTTCRRTNKKKRSKQKRILKRKRNTRRGGASFYDLPHTAIAEVTSYLQPDEDVNFTRTSKHFYQDVKTIKLFDEEALEYVQNENENRGKIERKYDIRFPASQLHLYFENKNFNNINLHFGKMPSIYCMGFHNCQFKPTVEREDIIKNVMQISFYECYIPNLSFLSSVTTNMFFMGSTIKNTNFSDILKNCSIVMFVDVTVTNENNEQIRVIPNNVMLNGGNLI